MLLEGKAAVIHGGGGAIGGAVARAFAREGASVHLAGRTAAKLDEVAREIAAAGGAVTTAQLDAVEEHADALAADAGRIDVAVKFLGYGVTCGAIETFSRILAGELGAAGVRVVCIRPDAIPEAAATSHTGEVFGGIAERAGISVEDMLEERARTATLLHGLPTLDEVAEFAVFAASDRAGSMTGAIANLSSGSLVD